MHYMGEELEGEKRREEAERKGGKRGRICTVEPLYSGHYWNQHFVPKRGVPNSGAFGMFTVGVVLHNRDVKHNMATFSELSLAVRWQGRLCKG